MVWIMVTPRRAMQPALGPDHWRDRARQARSVAQWMTNPEARDLLHEVADRYDRIAILAADGLVAFGPVADEA